MLGLIIITAVLGMSVPVGIFALTRNVENNWVRFAMCAVGGVSFSVMFSYTAYLQFIIK